MSIVVDGLLLAGLYVLVCEFSQNWNLFALSTYCY